MIHKAVKLGSMGKSVPIFGMVVVPQYTGIPLQLPGSGGLNMLDLHDRLQESTSTFLAGNTSVLSFQV